MSGTARQEGETRGAGRRSGRPAEESGRLVPWPRSGSEGGVRALTFVDDPELVQALDQLGAAMGGVWARARPATPARAGRKLLAASQELRSLAAFLVDVSSEGPATAPLGELAKGKASELRGMAEELEAAAARDMPERPDDGLDREGHDGSGAARSVR